MVYILLNLQVGDATDTIVPESNGSSPSKHHHHHHHHHAHSSANGKKKRASIHESLSSAELFTLYNMLNGVKLDLLWGRNSEEQPEEMQNQLDEDKQLSVSSVPSSSAAAAAAAVNLTSDTNANNSSTKDVKGHARRPSTASVASSNSATTLSDSDSEISTENDSGIESECKHETDKSRDLARQYRKHLLGLYRCLEQMTDAANYLTARYQSDIGPV